MEKQDLHEAINFLKSAQEHLAFSKFRDTFSDHIFKKFFEYLKDSKLIEAFYELKRIGKKEEGDYNFWGPLGNAAHYLKLEDEHDICNQNQIYHLAINIEMPEKCKGMTIIDLMMMCQPCLIVLDNTGIVYWNQTCNTACCQRGEEGFLIPISDYAECSEGSICFPLEDSIANLEWGPVRGINEERANEIDVIFQEHPETNCLSVDRKRLNESEEAWVYVSINIKKFNLGTMINSDKGVFVWTNSD